MRPHVITRKHMPQFSLAVLASGARTNTTLIDAVAVLSKNTPSEVEEGSVISAIYCEFWIKTNDSSEGTAIMIIEKIPAGATPPSVGSLASLDTYANKKNILHTFMGLTNNNVGVGMPMVRQWIKIPRGKQRFGLGDKLIISTLSQTGTLQICGFCIYKEQM